MSGVHADLGEDSPVLQVGEAVLAGHAFAATVGHRFGGTVAAKSGRTKRSAERRRRAVSELLSVAVESWLQGLSERSWSTEGAPAYC